MCRVSKAIAPRDAWAETNLGEWYWDQLPIDVPWWAIAWLDDAKRELETLFQVLPEKGHASNGTSKATEAAKERAPHRAPPRDRTLSIGTPARNLSSPGFV